MTTKEDCTFTAAFIVHSFEHEMTANDLSIQEIKGRLLKSLEALEKVKSLRAEKAKNNFESMKKSFSQLQANVKNLDQDDDCDYDDTDISYFSTLLNRNNNNVSMASGSNDEEYSKNSENSEDLMLNLGDLPTRWTNSTACNVIKQKEFAVRCREGVNMNDDKEIMRHQYLKVNK